jgi:hypothetical protein
MSSALSNSRGASSPSNRPDPVAQPDFPLKTTEYKISKVASRSSSKEAFRKASLAADVRRALLMMAALNLKVPQLANFELRNQLRQLSEHVGTRKFDLKVADSAVRESIELIRYTRQAAPSFFAFPSPQARVLGLGYSAVMLNAINALPLGKIPPSLRKTVLPQLLQLKASLSSNLEAALHLEQLHRYGKTPNGPISSRLIEAIASPKAFYAQLNAEAKHASSLLKQVYDVYADESEAVRQRLVRTLIVGGATVASAPAGGAGGILATFLLQMGTGVVGATGVAAVLRQQNLLKKGDITPGLGLQVATAGLASSKPVLDAVVQGLGSLAGDIADKRPVEETLFNAATSTATPLIMGKLGGGSLKPPKNGKLRGKTPTIKVAEPPPPSNVRRSSGEKKADIFVLSSHIDNSLFNPGLKPQSVEGTKSIVTTYIKVQKGGNVRLKNGEKGFLSHRVDIFFDIDLKAAATNTKFIATPEQKAVFEYLSGPGGNKLRKLSTVQFSSQEEAHEALAVALNDISIGSAKKNGGSALEIDGSLTVHSEMDIRIDTNIGVGGPHNAAPLPKNVSKRKHAVYTHVHPGNESNLSKADLIWIGRKYNSYKKVNPNFKSLTLSSIDKEYRMVAATYYGNNTWTYKISSPLNKPFLQKIYLGDKSVDILSLKNLDHKGVTINMNDVPVKITFREVAFATAGALGAGIKIFLFLPPNTPFEKAQQIFEDLKKAVGFGR